MIYTSYSDDVEGQLLKAIDAGLIAAAATYQAEVKERLAPGYTSGDYVTGTSLGEVAVTAPEDDGEGRAVRVGTNLLYNLYWELGWTPQLVTQMAGLAGGTVHAPIYRKEIWRPALVDTQGRQFTAFERAFGFVMNKRAA